MAEMHERIVIVNDKMQKSYRYCLCGAVPGTFGMRPPQVMVARCFQSCHRLERRIRQAAQMAAVAAALGGHPVAGAV
jgi:hypothetical protein